MKAKASQQQKRQKELEKSLRLCRGVLPVGAVTTLATGILAWRWPFWLTGIAFGMCAFTFVGDLVGVVWCTVSLRRLDRQRQKAEPAADAAPARRGATEPERRATGVPRTSNGPPALIAINHDDDVAKYVGRTAEGLQFFLTNPFEPRCDGLPGNEFLALFLFDQAGKLVEAKIDEFGPRAGMDEQKLIDLRKQRLQELGKVSFERIEVAPFAVERFGTTFGLVPRPPEGDDGDASWWVELLPGNYMAFHEPWDSGEYDT